MIRNQIVKSIFFSKSYSVSYFVRIFFSNEIIERICKLSKQFIIPLIHVCTVLFFSVIQSNFISWADKTDYVFRSVAYTLCNTGVLTIGSCYHRPSTISYNSTVRRHQVT